MLMIPPSLDAAAAMPTARLLKQGDQIGCEISGPNRPTMQWWFSGDTVEVRFQGALSRNGENAASAQKR